jgi:type IV pilus assembly protein PilQ
MMNMKLPQELEAEQNLQTVDAVRTQNFRLNYARADELARQLQAGVGAARLLSPRGHVMAEVRTNQLFVTDVASRVAQVTSLVRLIDVPVRQVMIEARIVEAADTFGKTLGAVAIVSLHQHRGQNLSVDLPG